MRKRIAYCFLMFTSWKTLKFSALSLCGVSIQTGDEFFSCPTSWYKMGILIDNLLSVLLPSTGDSVTYSCLCHTHTPRHCHCFAKRFIFLHVLWSKFTHGSLSFHGQQSRQDCMWHARTPSESLSALERY